MLDYDSELMARVSCGDDDAFRTLFDRYYSHAVNIAYRTLGDRDLAEDVAQDAFINIYESKCRYKPSAKFSTYLYRIVLNLALNKARRRKTVQEKPLDESLVATDSSSDPESSVGKSEVGEAVRKAILALPENQRVAIVLVRYEEMSYEDTARVMGLSIGAVESLLHRAKQNLRKSLSEYLDLE